MARIGSFINGPIETYYATNVSVGFALLVGFFVCVFSLIMAFLLVGIDIWAAKKDGVKVEISEDEKFKFSDLKKFNGLPFWLVTMSCVIIYMVIFPYVTFSSDMLQSRFGFGNSAGTFYALPYIISGVMSPILGFVIDKIGKRALFSKYTPLIKRAATAKSASDWPTNDRSIAVVEPRTLASLLFFFRVSSLRRRPPISVPAFA